MKQATSQCSRRLTIQPPSGGCVLKPVTARWFDSWLSQPPSGGCVLKPQITVADVFEAQPAAFRRLCVETVRVRTSVYASKPAAFRRLCVETRSTVSTRTQATAPAAFRRLCVETTSYLEYSTNGHPAAFRRLCVETVILAVTPKGLRAQPPSGGCVLKQVCTIW